MAADINAAKILGMTDDQMEEEVADRLGGINFETLEENVFRPMRITPKTFESMEDIATQLGIANPLEAVIDTLEELQESLSEYSLSNERLPTFDNPFNTNIFPDLVGALNNQLPPLNTTALPGTEGFVGANYLTSLPSNRVGADGLTDGQRAIIGNDSLLAGIARKSNLSKQKPTNQNMIKQP